MATTMQLPYTRYVAQVMTDARPKSSYLAMMADLRDGLMRCLWRETSTANATLTPHDFQLPSYIDDSFDAFKMTGAYNVDDMTERGFAGMAAYRFTLPAAYLDGDQTITGVSLGVSRDRFCRSGLHVAVEFSDRATPSTDWSTVRGTGDNAAAGALSQSTVANLLASSAAFGVVALEPVNPENKTAYLWVYVTLEDYEDRWELYSASEARQYAIEGSAMLVGGDVSVTFSADVAEGGSVIHEGGSSPTNLQLLAIPTSNGRSATTAGTTATVPRTHVLDYSASNHPIDRTILVVEYAIMVSNINLQTGTASVTAGGSMAWTTNQYERPPTSGNYYKATTVNESNCILANDVTDGTVTLKAGRLYRRLSLSASFSIPQGTSSFNQTSTKHVNVAYTTVDGRPTLVFLSHDTSATDSPVDAIESVAYLDVTPAAPSEDAASVLHGESSAYGGEWAAFGDMSWQIATSDQSKATRTAADDFRHLMGMASNAPGRIAHNYAFAASATSPYLLRDCDQLTVVPRFARSTSAVDNQLATPQPGISLWFHRVATSVSASVFSSVEIRDNEGVGSVVPCTSLVQFVQGSYIAVPVTAGGRSVVLRATASVANTGLTLRLACWRSSGEAWYRTTNLVTAAAICAQRGFALANVPAVEVPDISFDGHALAGLPPAGGVSASLLGVSAEITGALDADDEIAIPLTGAVSPGDILILAPVPIAFSEQDNATDAYFGRQANPAGETTKSWARYTANLGWFPEITII